MTTWTTDKSGLTASTPFGISGNESRLLADIPVTDTILPVIPPTAAEQREAIQNQINSLERQQLLPRVTREGLLNTFVVLAAAQGITEAQLYIDNIAYKKTKDFDAAITVLRLQMEAIV